MKRPAVFIYHDPHGVCVRQEFFLAAFLLRTVQLDRDFLLRPGGVFKAQATVIRGSGTVYGDIHA